MMRMFFAGKARGRRATTDWINSLNEVACACMPSYTTSRESAKIIAGAVTAVVATLFLFAIAMAFLLPQ